LIEEMNIIELQQKSIESKSIYKQE